MELLDNKHVQDVVWQLQRLVLGLSNFHAETLQVLSSDGSGSLFPVEVDLSRTAFQYQSTSSTLPPQVDEKLSDYFINIIKNKINMILCENETLQILENISSKSMLYYFIYSVNYSLFSLEIFIFIRKMTKTMMSCFKQRKLKRKKKRSAIT